MVPALIIHCCSEIERKGLDEAGLYRIPGSDREVKELRERIVKSKSGIPLLTGFDVHLLCGVVKDFLRSLDEPLVTRVLWRDFVRAAEQSDLVDRQANVWHSVNELPAANKDTLAYMMMHLQRISQSVACKMPKSNLARVFGPTLVGHSIADPPMVEMLAETKKQIAVMEALLEIPTDQWDNLMSQNQVCAEQEEYNPIARRTSIGARPLGGTLITNGTMTPRRQPPTYGTQSSNKYLKPLF
jgi:Rac GTPase-activating protein 1